MAAFAWTAANSNGTIRSGLGTGSPNPFPSGAVSGGHSVLTAGLNARLSMPRQDSP
jgi:hypothetical protein